MPSNRRGFWEKAVARARMGAANALELARVGRLGQPYGAPFDIIDQGPHHRLRRYATTETENAPVALLVPPLMVTSEVYDLEAENSAVVALGTRGVQPYVVDFGAPEREQGGMKRTLDDHILAVVRSVEAVRRVSGRKVHLCGYSQGGMFAYQTAAYLRSEGIASVVTFGAPVDIHKNLPALHKDATALFVRIVEPIVTKSIERIEGLPGVITSTGFKILSTRKEIQQRLEFLTKLHDRGALVRREARRRFLGGEGFVAWPGPAFREFVEQFIVHNRMLSGGFVLSGRTVTLADIRCPVLAFYGKTDDMARPPTIRAITRAAPDAAVSFVGVKAGHFGIVIGSRANRETWPVVAQWVRHHDGLAELPSVLRHAEKPNPSDDEPEGAGFDVDVDWSLFIDTITDNVKAIWDRVGDVASSASDAFDGVRYQEPKLRKLESITPDTRTSAGYSLRQRAEEQPDATFFLWQSRAFTYRDADTRVTNVVKGLWASGVRAGMRVGVVMLSRPSLLSMVTALSRLGAVAVLAPPDASPDALANGLKHAAISFLATDPQNTKKSRSVFTGTVLVLGGGGGKRREMPENTIDMEAIDPDRVALPVDLPLDAGRARDLAIILLRPSDRNALRAAPVTNHRWALSAVGASAACTLKPDDTVYSCIPLHHPAGILVSVGSALVAGARLALAEKFSPENFVAEVRRYGATVAFYAGEMLRSLLFTPPGRGDRTLPLRLFAGSGMRDDLWRKLKERFGVGVMEFYASTTQRVIMANASGEKVGSLGRSLPGSQPVELVKIDFATRLPLRDTDGRLVRTGANEAGLLATALDADDPTEGPAVVANAFEPGDRWLLTADIMRRDDDGDLWFVDGRAGIVITPHGFASTRNVESALFTLPEVEMAAAWGEKVGGEWRIVAAIQSRAPIDSARIDQALSNLSSRESPARVLEVDHIPLTEGFRPDKPLLRQSLSQVSELLRE